jgi:hypothetical protein
MSANWLHDFECAGEQDLDLALAAVTAFIHGDWGQMR